MKARRGGMDQGIALSIFGGVDSMAVAYLVSRWRDEHPPSTCVAAVLEQPADSPYSIYYKATASKPSSSDMTPTGDDQCETAVLRAMNGCCDGGTGL
ncbi:hypothetical protein A4X13_0g9127 [Tilletia indica]|uniref:Uncharacterized protein n=1 Tax=Tilletia indica TaxID=43049 RepID=A0A177T834_9BASI|nr:hypothetical protein A4X13_0g9127 [Tilletia indica]